MNEKHIVKMMYDERSVEEITDEIVSSMKYYKEKYLSNVVDTEKEIIKKAYDNQDLNYDDMTELLDSYCNDDLLKALDTMLIVVKMYMSALEQAMDIDPTPYKAVVNDFTIKLNKVSNTFAKMQAVSFNRIEFIY